MEPGRVARTTRLVRELQRGTGDRHRRQAALTALTFASIAADRPASFVAAVSCVANGVGDPQPVGGQCACVASSGGACVRLEMPPADAAVHCRYWRAALASSRAIVRQRCNLLEVLEARPGIEPGCEDLQSSTSPLRHRAGERRRCKRIVALSTLGPKKSRSAKNDNAVNALFTQNRPR